MTKFLGACFLLFLLVIASVGLAQTAPAAGSLLSNGDFELATKSSDWPDDWSRPAAGASYETEDGNHYLRLSAQDPPKMMTLYRVVNVSPEHKAYALTFRARAIDLKPGKANWHDGRIIIDFKDDGGKKVGSGGAPNFKGTTKGGWVERRVEFLVPEGATKLEVMPAMFNVTGGTLDLDDLRLESIDPTPVIAAKEAAAAKKAADIAKNAAKVKPQAPVASPDQYPQELKVVGNEIHTADGKAIWLQGISLASLEWSAAGERIHKSTEVALDEWKANVVRLPVAEHFYAGTGPWQNDGGAGYRQIIEDVVNRCAARGKYVVIDLHRFRAPEQKHADFWKAVAERYKNHPAVLFELYNEPHDLSWDAWRYGGKVSDTREKREDDPAVENNEKMRAFETIGMQRLVDVIRETGARNPIIAGGLDWSYDISGVLKGYALDDPNGNGIIYSTHVYPWKSKWQSKFLDVAAKHPIFVGELGAEPERMPFIKPEAHEDPHTWSPDMLALIQKHKLHWTGWCFHPKSSPRLLLDWDYTPTPFWGEYVKRALAGEQFELKRMR